MSDCSIACTFSLPGEASGPGHYASSRGEVRSGQLDLGEHAGELLGLSLARLHTKPAPASLTRPTPVPVSEPATAPTTVSAPALASGLMPTAGPAPTP